MQPTQAKYPLVQDVLADGQDGSSKSRERMFCHVAPIRMPCSRSLPCCPADLICRCECAKIDCQISSYGLIEFGKNILGGLYGLKPTWSNPFGL
jgi:hypothetical protein